MDDFLTLIIRHFLELASAFEGIMVIIVLWNIEKDLQILIVRRSLVEEEIKKISISLLGSLNDVRKLVNKTRNDNGRSR